MTPDMPPQAIDVLRLSAFDPTEVASLLARYGMVLEISPDDLPIEGSYWGDDEAGLVGNRLLARQDTPVHSILHETCHYVCMDGSRRQQLHTDASGGYDEENGVCYLQILLAGELPGMGVETMFRDMDAWGYSFRLGSSKDWFEKDAADACLWLLQHNLITGSGRPTFQLRK